MINTNPPENPGVTCPSCKTGYLIDGPCGGGSQNMACPSCYSEFNDTGPLGMEELGKLTDPGRQWRKQLYGL